MNRSNSYLKISKEYFWYIVMDQFHQAFWKEHFTFLFYENKNKVAPALEKEEEEISIESPICFTYRKSQMRQHGNL